MDRVGRQIVLIAALAAASILPACSSDGDDTGSDGGDEPTTSAEATTSTAPEETKTTVDTGDPSWVANAVDNRGRNGERFDQECPPNPDERAGSVWGLNTYTDDSSICTAAVQVGLITFAEGGTVSYEIAPGEDSYLGGVNNGVTSQRYGSWSGSFTFPDAEPIEAGADPASWTETALGRGASGTRFEVNCSPGGTPGSVWGSGPYTGDSSVCTAAVHSGVITVEDGGVVTAEVGPAKESYDASDRNGIDTSEYGSYDPSFTIVPAS